MRSWPHAPSKAVSAPGLFLVAAGTHLRQQFFQGEQLLAFVETVPRSMTGRVGVQDDFEA
jgi:hypothetical protein